ncbi:MAG: glycosyltransferase family 4 protein [Anaerolineae bacterium]|nr:glycosyltransferase family 4 protein [Anaerolineae bacterium]
MTDLYYLANIRLPTEKAHGLQIMQNCEAFAASGARVTLFAARRINTPELARVRDVWAHYNVARAFEVRRVPCLDLFPWLERVSARLAFAIQALTYTLALWLWMLVRRADVYYSRDVLTLVLLSLVKPRRALVYEAHQRSRSGPGRWLQRACARRCGLVVAVTESLAGALREMGAARALVAHDGFRAERFAGMPAKGEARARLHLPADAFVVGYVGRLHTMSMSKGVDTLVEAAARAERPLHVLLVGGPQTMAEALRDRWRALGLPDSHFHAPGDVPAADVPAYLAAFDVGTMTLPWTPHFAYDASPLKLFEYMAAGCAILASDLPSVREVLRDGDNALLVPPGDADALAGALRRLYDDRGLVARLGAAANAESAHFTWTARAARILDAWRSLAAPTPTSTS